MSSRPRAARGGPPGLSGEMQSSDRKDLTDSQSRAESARHKPRTVSSTDTRQLDSLSVRCRCPVCGAQEASGALLAHDVGSLAVEEGRASADENGVHGVVVAVDHAGQAAVLLDALLG